MMILKTSRSNLSSNDQLSLDLPFAATKSLAARVGPTPTFTRGSGATYIGSDGRIHGVDTSTTSNTIGTGSRTFTLAATAGQDQFWRAGDAVEASNGSNFMVGTVTNYSVALQLLVCNMTSIGGSGTFTSWRIGYRGPRFDHDPVTLACKGLLIEEGRTNLFSSTNLNDWLPARVTKTPITGIGLTNQATTLTISETGSTYISRGATLTTGVAYAISLRVKAGTVASFNFADLTDGKYSRAFNLSTNQWAASGGAVEFTNYTVTPNIDGWFLVSAIYTPTGATGGKNIVFLLGGSVVGQTVSFDTPQIEAGSFPTSYIPTTTGSLARSADVCNITGGDFNNFYNQSEGTFLLKATSLMATATGGNRTFVSFTDGGYINQQGLYKATNTNNLSFPIGVGIGPAIGTLTAGSPFAVSGAMQVANNAAAFNGAAAVAVTGSAATGISKLEFRDPTAAASGHPTMHISQFRYYKKRLPNAKLAQLTV